MRLPVVEKLVHDFLSERLHVPVVGKVPKKRPATFIRAWRNGGSADNPIVERAQITVDVYARTAFDASVLAGQARDLLLQDYTAMPLVRAVEETGAFYYAPDTEADHERYRFTVALTVRAART